MATLKILKKILREMGWAPPYLGELRRKELENWMAKHLTADERSKVLARAREE